MRKIALGLAALIAVAFVVPSYGAMDRPAKEIRLYFWWYSAPAILRPRQPTRT